MKTLFAPRSVLVVGASSRPGNLAANIVRNLMDSGFPGEVHLFGRRPGSLYGRPILTSWEHVPDGIDMAAVLVPAPQVPEVIERCGERGILRAAIATGGFSEHSGAGEGLEGALLAAARKHGVRFTGPNGLGVMDMRSRLNTLFMHIPDLPRAGGIHLLAQSGGVGAFYMQRFVDENLGMASFVSLGNKLDVDECTLLDYLRAQAPRLVCVYVEDLRDGRRFFEATRDYPCPLIVQKASVSKAGAAAAASHTAAIAVDDRILDAALTQNRVGRVQDMSAMINSAKAFSVPPLKGNRLLIVSRSGGHAVIAADLSERYGFELPPLDEQVAETTRNALRANVVEPRNPLDLGDVFDMGVYYQVIEQGLASPEVDGVVFVHTFMSPGPELEPTRQLVDRLAHLGETQSKPIFLSLLTSESELARMRRGHTFPIFSSPEDAMWAAAANREYTLPSNREVQAPAPLPPFADEAVIRHVLEGAAPGYLPGAQALEIVRAAGIRSAPFGVAREPEDLEGVIAEVGLPVVMKILSSELSHKSDSGGVVLNVASLEEARAVHGQLRELAAQLTAPESFEGILVQQHKRGFREVFLGGRRDPSFGPLVMVGLGGVLVEVFHDIAIRLAPLTPRDLDDLIDGPLSFKALKGVRRVPPADLEWLRDAILRVSRLLLDFPSIREIDINPVKLHRAGRKGVAVDARVVVG